MPPTQAHSNAYSYIHLYTVLFCFQFAFPECWMTLLVCLCRQCVSVCFHVSLHPPLPLLSPFPPPLSSLSPVCLSVLVSISVGLSVSVSYHQSAVPNTLFEFLAISPWLVASASQADLDDMEFLSHAYVFRHLIVPLADTLGPVVGMEQVDPENLPGSCRSQGSVQITSGVLEAMTFRIAFFSTSHVTLGKVKCFCSHKASVFSSAKWEQDYLQRLFG